MKKETEEDDASPEEEAFVTDDALVVVTGTQKLKLYGCRWHLSDSGLVRYAA